MWLILSNQSPTKSLGIWVDLAKSLDHNSFYRNTKRELTKMSTFKLFMSAKEIKIIDAKDIHDAVNQVPEMTNPRIMFGQVDFAFQWVDNVPYEILEVKA